MRIRAPGPVASAAFLVAAGAVFGLLYARRAPSARTAIACDGEYADSLQILSPRAREIEQGTRSAYTYLIRNTAKYECPYFAPDGKLRRRRIEAVEHGTAFAYEVSASETYLLTNEHLAVWPEVTDDGHRIEGVHDGCKRVEAKLRIVNDEGDDYYPGHIPLALVATDPLLDAAILRSGQRLTAIPYRVGKSAALRQGNSVQVRGFPLGLIHAVNTGKVVNPYDHDHEQGWNHVDFVVDALLSEGNSGSPVLALSCKTGELQLVGMYHAGYKGASALNVVVGVDQLREFMLKKKRIPRAQPEGGHALEAADRERLREGLGASDLSLFEFGGLALLAETRDETLLYHVFGSNFPTDDRRLAVLEDHTAGTAAGEIAQLWVRGDAGWREWRAADLGTDEQDLLLRLGDAVRLHMLRVLGYRRALAHPSSPEERRRVRELLKAIERHSLPERELAGQLVDLSERLAPLRDGQAPMATAPGAAPTPPLPPLPKPAAPPGAAELPATP